MCKLQRLIIQLYFIVYKTIGRVQLNLAGNLPLKSFRSVAKTRRHTYFPSSWINYIFVFVSSTRISVIRTIIRESRLRAFLKPYYYYTKGGRIADAQNTRKMSNDLLGIG